MAAASSGINGYMTGTYATKLDGIATGATANTGTVTSVNLTGGTAISVSGGPITSSGSITVNNTGVTSVTAGTGISVSAATGGVTISASGGGTVSSVATGNGLSGGTITTTGTLVVACPTFNTVGSYVFAIASGQGGYTVLNSGSNYSAGTGGNQMQSTAIRQDDLGSPFTSNNLSGSWKWMSGTIPNAQTSAGCFGIACRVS